MHSNTPIPDDFHQLELLFTAHVQYNYEAVRNTVLGFETVATRSEQTGIDRATLGEKARSFILVDHCKANFGRKSHKLPEAIADTFSALSSFTHQFTTVRLPEYQLRTKPTHQSVQGLLFALDQRGLHAWTTNTQPSSQSMTASLY